jgi:hypothetical protein
MATANAQAEQVQTGSGKPLWVESLGAVARRAGPLAEYRMKTRLNFDIRSSKPSLFVPPDMAELQPASLRYLHTFTQRHEMTLVEDRRALELQPTIEQRDQSAPMLAIGISLLLKQTGLPGIAKVLSNPHRLNADSPCIPIPTLVQMAAHAVSRSKRVVILPNRMIVNVLDNDTQPIAGYACKLLSKDGNTVLSHFDSKNFRAIGYSAGNQYIMHVCLAGGPLNNPLIWANFHTLTRTDIQFQLFPGKLPANDFGLFYATYYLNMAEAPLPWWLNTDFQSARPDSPGDSDYLHRKAS